MIRRFFLRHGLVITRVWNGKLRAFSIYAEPLRWYFGIAFWRRDPGSDNEL